MQNGHLDARLFLEKLVKKHLLVEKYRKSFPIHVTQKIVRFYLTHCTLQSISGEQVFVWLKNTDDNMWQTNKRQQLAGEAVELIF